MEKDTVRLIVKVVLAAAEVVLSEIGDKKPRQPDTKKKK